MLYKISSTDSAPAHPDTVLTWNFANKAFTDNASELDGWTVNSVPESDNSYVWNCSATAAANTSTDDIAVSEWTDPEKIGSPKAKRSATVFVYYGASGQTAARAKPSVGSTSYNFDTTAFSNLPTGWSAATATAPYTKMEVTITEASYGGSQTIVFDTPEFVSKYSTSNPDDSYNEGNTSQMNALSNPKGGDLFYNTTEEAMYTYNENAQENNMGAWVKTATIGAKAGTDIKDSAGNVLANEDIRNDDLSINYSGTNIQIKKGNTQIGSNTASPNAILNAHTTYAETTGTKPPADANKTVVAAGTDGRLTVATNGATAATIKVFSDAEITKLVNLRAGKNPADATKSILNSETTYAETTGTKPPADANNVSVASGTDGQIAITTNGGTPANVNVYSSAEKTKINRLQDGKSPGDAAVSILNADTVWNDVSGTTNAPANNATVGAVAGTNLFKEDGSTSLTNALIVTSEGTSSDTANVNSVAAATISSGAALGSSANQDSTASIRNGITTFERDVSDIFWTNISGQMSPTATSYAVTITWRNGSGTSLGTTVITLALANSTSLSAAVTTSNGAGATVSLGGAANTNVLQNTTVTKNGIVCNVRAQIIDGSGWNFK